MDGHISDSGILGGALDAVLAAYGRVAFPAGTVIFREGDDGDRAFAVESGLVELTRRTTDGHALVLGTVGTCGMFGEMALIDGQPRMADAVALTDTRCVELPRSLVLAETAGLSPFARFLMNTLMIHVRNLGIRMASQEGLAKVPFTERFVHAYIAHARGMIDVSHFFCGADGSRAEKALMLINDDAVSRGWCCISFKVTFAGHLDILCPDEHRTFRETFGDALMAEHEDDPSELIHTALAEKANLVAAAWQVYVGNLSSDFAAG